MLRSLLNDFSKLDYIEIHTLLAEPIPAIDCPWTKTDVWNEIKQFQQCVIDADASLIIAPETDQLLLERVRWATEVNGTLLSCPASVVKLTADKLLFSKHLEQFQLPTPKTVTVEESFTTEGLPYPLVRKQRYGAGSAHTQLITDAHSWQDALSDIDHSQFVIQPFVPGQAASVAVIAGTEKTIILPPAYQNISTEGRFEYLGGSVPLEPHLARRARRWAEQVIQTLPEATGYVGIDLILGNEYDGSKDVILEVNPRLTTSYVGLQALAKSNLAEVMIQLYRGETIEPLQWLDRIVSFDTAGDLRFVKIR